MSGKTAWIHPVAWMTGFAAATAWTIMLLAVIASGPFPGPAAFFQRLVTDVPLQISVVGTIGCAFLATLLIAQGLILLLQAVKGRSS
jgi:hypothetical protein